MGLCSLPLVSEYHTVWYGGCLKAGPPVATEPRRRYQPLPILPEHNMEQYGGAVWYGLEAGPLVAALGPGTQPSFARRA